MRSATYAMLTMRKTGLEDRTMFDVQLMQIKQQCLGAHALPKDSTTSVVLHALLHCRRGMPPRPLKMGSRWPRLTMCSKLLATFVSG